MSRRRFFRTRVKAGAAKPLVKKGAALFLTADWRAEDIIPFPRVCEFCGKKTTENAKMRGILRGHKLKKLAPLGEGGMPKTCAAR